MSENMLTQEVPLEKLNVFNLRVINEGVSANQLLSINNFQFGTEAGAENKGEGIGVVQLILAPNEKPKLLITYHKYLIEEEVARCLGLKKEYR